MFIYHGLDFDYTETNGTLQALRSIKYFQDHENFRKKARIKKPRFLPVWMCYLFIENFGKEGYISFIEFDSSYNVDIYTVIFGQYTSRIKMFFSEEELCFY